MTPPRTSLVLDAPAKVNLYLHVLGRRADGYHELETWMQKIDLCDRVFLEVIEGPARVEFGCNADSVPAGPDNLAARAAQAFFAACPRRSDCGIRIALDKQIPVAAGLGGGSSDAGAVLRGMNELFGSPLESDELLRIACTLGADVPFFAVDIGAVVARGIGEILHPVPSLCDCRFVVVNPPIFVSTAWVFRNFPLTTEVKPSKLSCFQRHGSVSSLLSEMHNDLEAVTAAKYPQIDEIKGMLGDLGAARVLMSGSGPTVFGVFPDGSASAEEDLGAAVEELRTRCRAKVYLSRAYTGASPSGKAPGFDPGIRRFESFRPSQC